MIKNRSRTVRAAVVAGVMALLLGPAGAAQAAVVPVSFTISGGILGIGAVDIPLPGGGTIAGDWDDVTGDFTGALTIAPFVVPASDDVPLELTVSITATPLVGTVPPDGTVGTVTTELTATINALGGVLVCNVGPIALELSTTLVEEAGVVTLVATDAGFTVPAVVATAACALADTVNGVLGLPTSDSSLELTAVLGGAPAPTPTPVTPAEVEAEVVAAAATPKFTG
jgi:hypothetical protein